MAREYTEEDIMPLDESEFYRKSVFEPAEIDLLYVILGFLQEYFGGYHLDEERVDMFFVNEYEQAQVFNGLCQAYLGSLGLESDVELIKVETGHSYVRSKQICTIFQKIFTVREPDFLNHKCYHLSKEDELFKLPHELYLERSQRYNFKRYSYLLGVFIKNRDEEKHKIYFANAGHKAKLTIEILQEFEAFGARSFQVTYHFGVPYVTQITLDPNCLFWAEVASLIKKYKTA